MYFAIKTRGSIGSQKVIRDTLTNLYLTKNNGCMIYPENPTYAGMLKTVKDYVAFGKITKEDFKLVLEKRGYIGHKKITESLGVLNYKDIDEIIKDLFEGKITISELKNKGLKVPFRLKAPSKGYKGFKKGFNQGGVLGNHGDKINLLLKKML